jgi:hypothetical protein
MDYENNTEDFSSDWLQAELDETLDDLFEMEFNEPMLSQEIRKIYKRHHPDMLDNRTYYPTCCVSSPS